MVSPKCPGGSSTRTVAFSGENAMTESVLYVLEFDDQIAKRVQWQGFEFTILGEGDVEVVNASHEDPAEHSHTVHVGGDLPSDCSCSAQKFGGEGMQTRGHRRDSGAGAHGRQ